MNKQNKKLKAIKELQLLRNIGPATVKRLYSIGIKTPEQMRRSDPEKLYEKLKKKEGDILDKCVLYVFRGAILDIPWPKCKNIIKYSKGRLKNKIKRR